MTSPGPTALTSRPCKGRPSYLRAGYTRWGWRGAWASGGGVAGLFTLAVALAACSGQAATHLPARPSRASAPSPASPSPLPSHPSTRAMVRAAYLGIWAAGDQAEQSGQAARARLILAPHATKSYIRFMVSGMAPYWHRHEAARGHMTDHIQKITLVRGRGGSRGAIVVDCQDASHHTLARSSGRLVPGSAGPPHARLYASLVFQGGRWLVDHITFAGSRC